MNKMMLHHPKGVIEMDTFLQLIWSTFKFSATQLDVEPRILHKVDAYPWAGNFGNSGVSPKMSVGFWTSSFFGFIFQWSVAQMSRYFCYQCASRVLPEVMRVDNGVCRCLIGPLQKKKRLIGPHQQWCKCQTLRVWVYRFAYRWNVPSNLLIL